MNNRKEFLIKLAETIATSIHNTCSKDEAMDGDETEYISKQILKKLDELNGNN